MASAMVTSASIDTQTLLDTLDKRISALESFAIRHRLPEGVNQLPALGKPRTFHTTRALYNALDSTIVKIGNVADKLPRNISYGRSHIQAKVIDYDPGELFMKTVNEPITKLMNISKEINKINSKDISKESTKIVHEQVKLLRLSLKEESKLISKASRMAKPNNDKQLRKECETLVDITSDISDLKYDLNNKKCKLNDHCMVLGDFAASLGWILSPTPLKFIREYKHIIETLTSNILANYIELGCNPIHSLFAETLNNLISVICDYVEKEHPAGLRWNYAQGSIPLGYKRAQRNLTKFSHPIADCLKLIDNAVTDFYFVSKELGQPLFQISEYIRGAYEEMCKAIETAANKPKPKGWGDSNSNVGDDVKVTADLKMLLISVQNELIYLDNILNSVKQGEKFYEHCQAIREFVLCMQWTSATLQKMSPVGYIIGVENVVSLYLDKVLKIYGPSPPQLSPASPSFKTHDANTDKNTRDKCWQKFDERGLYVQRLHAKWVQSVKSMMKELKEYVKVHHPNELMFDTGRSRRSVDDIFQNTTLNKQLDELREKSSVKKWKKVERMKTTKNGKQKSVLTWTKA